MMAMQDVRNIVEIDLLPQQLPEDFAEVSPSSACRDLIGAPCVVPLMHACKPIYSPHLRLAGWGDRGPKEGLTVDAHAR